MESVLVIGAGVIGRCCAFYLARRGFQVHLIEAGSGPSCTSRASLGILTHANGGNSPYSQLYRDAHAGFAELAGQLEAETGVDIGWRPLGGVDLVCTDEDEETVRELMRFNQQRGCAAEWVEGADLRCLVPLLADRVRAGLYFADDHRVDPERLGEGLLRGLQQRGGRLTYGESLLGWEKSTGDHVAVRTSAGLRQADCIVLAAGAWSGVVGELAGAQVPVRPVRGQHGRFAGGDELGHILRYDSHYLMPADGHIVVGATVEEVEFEVATTPQAAEHFAGLFGALLRLRPQLLEQRVGLRPKPKGGRPLIGPLADNPRVFVASGHYKNGVLLGPITGQLISQWIAEGQPGRDMADFAPQR
ncbi:MAG: FAD-dependent oxidoreductase [Candidatus Latescibacteria bacterium]|nr:FAD-dependent oxidoreductase [Candidatus Latescibacterota bacterium]